MYEPKQIVIVSNRGPFSFSVREGQPVIERGSGGLVTAISGVAREHKILWISCALTKGDREWLQLMGSGVHAVEDMQVSLVTPDAAQYQAYYNVICNPLLWFIQHGLHDTPRSPVIDQSVWNAWTEGYRAINRQLAQAAAESIADLEGPVVVMPQDYHLYLFPHYLRELVGDKAIIQHFLHIPWPGPDAWRVLPRPMRIEILEAMLQCDRLGFQTERDTRRFLQTCTYNLPDTRVVIPWRKLAYKGREIEAIPYPISIDVDDLLRRAETREVRTTVARMQSGYGDLRMILRVDRVEPSKNILRGFIAYRNFLRRFPEYRGKVFMLALLVPSRSEVAEYKTYLRDIMALVGEINATMGESDWEPVHVVLGNNYDRAIAAFMMYDVLLVNPLADGMNLVAKEGAVLNRNDGVLILSDEAGAAEELGEYALLVSPYDVTSMRDALHQALTMPLEERRARAQSLAAQVTQHDIHGWFLRQIADTERDFQRLT
jgi:trehalose 6-phosphate synthase